MVPTKEQNGKGLCDSPRDFDFFPVGLGVIEVLDLGFVCLFFPNFIEAQLTNKNCI